MEALGTSKPSSRKHKPSKSLPATKKPAAVTIATASEAEKSATTPVQSLSPIEKSPPAVAASHDLNFLNSNRVKHLPLIKNLFDLLNPVHFVTILKQLQQLQQLDNLKFTILIKNLNKYKLKTVMIVNISKKKKLSTHSHTHHTGT